MIELGIVVSLIAAALACVVPAERVISVRKHHRAQMPLGMPLRTAFPVASANAEIDTLARAAVQAIDTSDIDRGVVGIAGVYRRAARPPGHKAPRYRTQGD